MSNIKYFRTWQGLANFLHQTDKFAQLQNEFYAQEQFPLSEREIKIQDNEKEIILKVFYDIDTMNISNPPAPYPSWTWNNSTKQWEPPVARPSSPKTEYDLIWNEDTQAWGLTGISLTRVDENGESFVSKKYFDTWDNLIEYLYKINTVKYVMPQILDQEKLELKDRKIITPHDGKFICLQLIG